MLDTLRAFLEPPLVYAVATTLLILVGLLLVLARYLNRRYVILHRSAGTDQIAYELARIANSLEIMAATSPRARDKFRLPETAPKRTEKPHEYQTSGVGLSMFGR